MAVTTTSDADVDVMRQRLANALQQVARDLSNVDRVARNATSSTGGISAVDGIFGGMAGRLLGPVGVVAALGQVGRMLEDVATKSVQLQALARNSNMAAEQIKDFQKQMRMMGMSSQEALGAVGALNDRLNSIRKDQYQSPAFQQMLSSTGGARIASQILEFEKAGDRIGSLNYILQEFNKQNDRGKMTMAEWFGQTVDTMERLRVSANLIKQSYGASREELEAYLRETIEFSDKLDDIWKNVAGRTIHHLNELTGGMNTSAETMKTIIESLTGVVDEFFQGVTVANEGFKKFFNFGGIKQDIQDIKDFIEFIKSDNKWERFKGDLSGFSPETEGGGGKPDGRYPQGGDPMGTNADYRQRFSKEYWQRIYPPRQGMSDDDARRTESIQQEQVSLLTEIRDTLQGKGPRIGGGSSGASGGGGGYELGRVGGRFSGTGGTDFAASRGATVANTNTAMQAAMDQLRKEGVPEANLKHAAAMLVGQAQAESSLNPNLSHDGGTGYGIYGARNERAAKMLKWMKENGYANNSLEGQMRYMAHEAMTESEYAPSRKALMGASEETMAAGTSVLTQNFERPRVDNSATRLAHSRAALTGGVTPQPGGTQSSFPAAGWGGTVLENQKRLAGIRKGSIDPRLRNAFDYASSKTGLTVDINSGGQRMPGAEGATGSHRHDQGRAADFLLRDSDGNIVNPNDPRALEFYRYAGQAGVTGGGHSYGDMGQRTHLDIDTDRMGAPIYAGGSAFREALMRGQRERDQYAMAARIRMDAAAANESKWAEGSVSAKVEFLNVPNGVRTTAESDGDIFKQLQVNKSKQNEVAGGSPGQPFAGVW